MACKIEKSEALEALNSWEITDDGRDAIKKEFKFEDFKDAYAFMTKIALKAEEIGHHPEWYNVYNKVKVTLTTHDANGITQLDIDLAKVMNKTFKI